MIITLQTLCRRPVFWYGVIALLVLGPLLLPGYILGLDMVWTPQLPMPQLAISGNNYIWQLLLWLADRILPSQLLQKLVLAGAIWLAGYGMHRLVGRLGTTSKAVPLYFAGILYAINPFTYDRFVSGQYLVLLGYALLPWFVSSLLALTAKPSWRQAARLAAWALAISIVSIHSIAPMTIIGMSIVVVRGYRLRHDKAGYWRLARYIGITAGIWLALSSYWLLPLALGQGGTARTVGGFSAADQSAFATLGDSATERLGNIMALQGFWLQGRDLFQLPQDGRTYWPLLLFGLLDLVIYGAITAWKRQRGITVVFIGCIVIGALLASGIGSGWLAGHIPLYAGYREPQKFAMLIALGYAVFAAFAADAILKRVEQWPRPELTVRAAGVIFIALPFLITPTIFWGANGQLRAADYPAGWYRANQELNKDNGDFQVLFLPWHLYIEAGFAGGTIANPAANFYDKSVVISDDPEFKGVSLAASTPLKRDINQALKEAPKSDSALGDELAELNVKYILLAETSDYERYGYLERQTNLELVGDYDGMKLYRNVAYIVRK